MIISEALGDLLSESLRKGAAASHSTCETLDSELARIERSFRRNERSLRRIKVRSVSSMIAADRVMAGVEALVARVEAMRPPVTAGLRARAVFDDEFRIHDTEVRQFRKEHSAMKISAMVIQGLGA